MSTCGVLRGATFSPTSIASIRWAWDRIVARDAVLPDGQGQGDGHDHLTIRRNSQVEIGRIASARSRRLLRRITVSSFTTAMEPVAPASEALTVASALAGVRMCRAGGASP